MTVTDPIFQPDTFAPAPATVFGPIVSAFEVEGAVAGCVRVWARDYLAEIERQRGLPVGRLPTFRSIVLSAGLEKLPEDQCPALLIASPGVETAAGTAAGRIETHGDGAYVARFRVDVAALISARGNRVAVRLARLYAAALRALLVQQALQPSPLSLRGIDWVTERYDLVDTAADRTLCAGVVQLAIEVVDVTNRYMGPVAPLLPPTDPSEPPDPMEWPVARTAEVTVTKQEE